MRITDSMNLENLEEIVHNTINYIKNKYPNEKNTTDRWMTLVTEEIGELARAINDGEINNFIEEATQSIAALYLMTIDFCKKQNCYVEYEDIKKE